MGTHPIFESDFDCLTGIEKKFRKAKMGNPSESGAAGDVKSSRSAASSKSDELGKWVEDKDYNPFKIPPDCDMFLIRDQERKNSQKKKKKKKRTLVCSTA